VGFTQSYTYFTWRNFKQELIDYFTELTQSDMAEYFRRNLLRQHTDILAPILQREAAGLQDALGPRLPPSPPSTGLQRVRAVC